MEGSVTNLQNPVIPVIAQDTKQPDASSLKGKDEFQDLLKNKESDNAKDVPNQESKETSKEEPKEAPSGMQGDVMQLIHLYDPARLKVWLGNMSNTKDTADTDIGPVDGLAANANVQNKESDNSIALPNVEVSEAITDDQSNLGKPKEHTETESGLPVIPEEVMNSEKTNALPEVKTDAEVEVRDNNLEGQTAKAEVTGQQESASMQKSGAPEEKPVVPEQNQDTPVQNEEIPEQKQNTPVQKAEAPVQKADVSVAFKAGEKQSEMVSGDSTVNDSAAISTLASELSGANETSTKEEGQSEQRPPEHSPTVMESVLNQTSGPAGRGTSILTPKAAASETVHVNVKQPEEIPQKIADSLITKLDARQKEIEIQLEPHNLGKIAIKVSYGQHDTAISIVCSNSKTLELLAQSAKDIGAIIETNLGSPTTIYVEKNVENYLDQGKNDNSDQSRGQQEQKNQEQNNRNQQEERLDFIQQLRLGLVAGSGQMYQNNY